MAQLNRNVSMLRGLFELNLAISSLANAFEFELFRTTARISLRIYTLPRAPTETMDANARRLEWLGIATSLYCIATELYYTGTGLYHSIAVCIILLQCYIILLQGCIALLQGCIILLQDCIILV